jgi:cobalamin biosynthesis Mg chelatase CobN
MASNVVEIATLIDLEASEEASQSPTVDTTQPKIIGKAAPNVTISIQVHSDAQIDQYIVADNEGNFELDISQLEQELESGEHTVTYSYEDPSTGETVTKTQTFYVSDTASKLAQADTGEEEEASSEGTQDYPYSSSSPYPMESTDSGEATDSGRTTQPSTESAVPVSGSVETTYALIFGGLFFILAGVWSWWIASNLEEELTV